MTVQFALSDTTLSVRDRLLEDLATLRADWEDAAGCESLLDISASVGLMLLDIATNLEMTPAERAFFLGVRLEQEAASILEENQN